MKKIKGGIDSVQGFMSSGITCGIKESGHKDIALIVSDNISVAAGVFTQNQVKAASVLWNQKALRGGKAGAIIVNSGNANACTGAQGMKDTEAMATQTARLLGLPANKVLVCSTGIIGVPLPMKKISKGIQEAFDNVGPKNGNNAAEAILTTDTFSKTSAVGFKINEDKIRIGGIAKGSGMICPNMATMLAFITTDISISPPLLKKALKAANEVSFNSITVDGDTSTNDSVLLFANGVAGNKKIEKEGIEFQHFITGLKKVCIDLAEQIIRDGEGATKFIRIRVKGAKSSDDAKKVAMEIANSSLVKTAIFGEDANWGRIVCAAGNAGVSVEFEKMDLSVGKIKIIKKGKPIAGTKLEDNVQRYLKEREVVINLALNIGNGEAEVLTTDLSHEYIRINSEYRT